MPLITPLDTFKDISARRSKRISNKLWDYSNETLNINERRKVVEGELMKLHTVRPFSEEHSVRVGQILGTK